MKFNLPQIYFSKLMRAITEFELIQDNDRIMIGVSGGKDSIFLAYAMAMMRQRIKKKFELMAVTVNPMFSDSFDLAPIKDFMQRLDIPHHSFDVDIKGAIDAQGGKDPCYTCAFFRRGAVNRYAKEQGCNKVAYAHHNDDAVETLFMGLLYSGQVHTFTPSTYLDKIDITVIRPLVYFREQEIIDAIQYHQVQPVPSPCPNDGHTIRQRVKELIQEMSIENPQLYPHLASAMRENAVGELWPAPKNRKEMKKAYYDYMYGNQ
ncbi:MAG: tRNA 2-thiocytidine biosynthesis TtcA family protein [Selenomonadaceae bacterium]|nr:tRNA 2-thiocytidine biosynthesis TtcA family protein [Selenomonadaceae bacterium]